MKITEEIMKPYLEEIAERVNFVLAQDERIRDINRIVYEFGEEMLPKEISSQVFIIIGILDTKNKPFLGYLKKEHFEVIRTEDSIHFCNKEHLQVPFGTFKDAKLLPLKNLTFTI